MMVEPDEFIVIPRLEEYYRGGPIVGWGEKAPERWRPMPKPEASP